MSNRKRRDPALAPQTIFVEFFTGWKNEHGETQTRRVTFGPFNNVTLYPRPLQVIAYEGLDWKLLCIAHWNGDGWLICDGLEDDPEFYPCFRLHTGPAKPDGPMIRGMT